MKSWRSSGLWNEQASLGGRFCGTGRQESVSKRNPVSHEDRAARMAGVCLGVREIIAPQAQIKLVRVNKMGFVPEMQVFPENTATRCAWNGSKPT